MKEGKIYQIREMGWVCGPRKGGFGKKVTSLREGEEERLKLGKGQFLLY